MAQDTATNDRCPSLQTVERRARRRLRAFRVSVFVFAVTALLAAVIVGQLDTYRERNLRERSAFIAADYAGKIRYALASRLDTVQVMDILIHLGRGDISDFDAVAREILQANPSLRNVALAPDGIVRRIAPLETNREAVGHNLFADPARSTEAELARDTGKLTVAGPFRLVQGGEGVAIRQPVYLSGPDGSSRFWGFVIATFTFPDMLREVQFETLATRGYAWELWRPLPETGEKQTLLASGGSPLDSPLINRVDMPNGAWYFALAPVRGWGNAPLVAAHIAVAFALCLLLALLSGLLVNLADKQKAVERLSRTDALTGLPNRRDFLAQLQKAVDAATRDGRQLAVCYLDLDGFKQINDTLGHAAGDLLLTDFADRLRAWLAPGEMAARLGGDEFVTAIRVRDRAHCAERLGGLMALVEQPYILECLELSVTASLGVALAPDDSDEAEVLLVLADKAMYAIKREGKRDYAFWGEKTNSDGADGFRAASSGLPAA